MGRPVKTRGYDASRRRADAAHTRTRILGAARDLFLRDGYSATSVQSVAELAEVSVDTIYASVGRKPELLLAVHDMELAEGAEPAPAEERSYVRELLAAATAEEKIRIYAAALARLLPRTVPLTVALREAGATDPGCRELYAALSARRAANMLRFAAELRSTGELRGDLTDDQVADLVWSMNSPDYFLLLQARGRTPAEFAELLTDVWTHTLLAR